MKTFLIFVLGIACLVLFYSVKMKSRQLEEKEAAISDLNSQLEAAKQGHEADVTKMKAIEQASVRVVPPAPVVVQTPVAAVVAPTPTRETALDQFARVMKTDITTSPPPFVIFMDEAAARRDSQTAEEQGLPQSDRVRRMGIDRYNGFMMHLFPGRLDLRMVPHTLGGPEEAGSGLFKLSPARLLWVAADDASPDAKYAVRWLNVNSPQLTVAQEAMQTLDQQIGGSDATLARSLHDAEESLKTMLNGRPPVVEDQRRVAFFLRTAGVSK